MKERLDVLLVKQGFAESREKAKAIIMSGIVFVDGQREDKAGATFEEDAGPAENKTAITKADLVLLGLSGGQDSAAKRQALLKKLDLPEHLTANGLLEALNLLYSPEELSELVKKDLY